MGYFPNSISGRNKRGAVSRPNAARSSLPATSYKLRHNWPQLVVLALGIHRRFGLFGCAGEAEADMSSLLNSLYNAEERPRRRRRHKHNNVIIILAASDNRARRTNKSARRAPGSSNNPQPLQSFHYYFLRPSFTPHLSFGLPQSPLALLLLCFVSTHTCTLYVALGRVIKKLRAAFFVF